MIKWEYLRMPVRPVNATADDEGPNVLAMNRLGAHGWELATSVTAAGWHWLLFKRPVAMPTNARDRLGAPGAE